MKRMRMAGGMPVMAGRLPAMAAGGLLAMAVVGCSDGGGSGAPAAGAAPAASTAPAAQARRVAHLLEDLERAGARAQAHHTVLVELQHPEGGQAAHAKRVIPYRFAHAATRTVCLAPGDGPDLRIELRRSGGTGEAEVTLTRDVPCRQMRFEAGDYEAHLHHLGGAQTGKAVHVFAQPRYEAIGTGSPLGRLLQRSADAAVAKARAPASDAVRAVARKAAAACTAIDTTALRNNATGTYFRSSLPARYADYFEMYRVSAAGLIAPAGETSPTADGLMTVYACGDAPDGVLKFANADGAFLQSRCGYPLFSATRIEDATGYRPVWNATWKRLDLINDDNDALLTGIERSAGRVIGGTSTLNADAQPGLGTCAAMPADLSDPQVTPIVWKGYESTYFNVMSDLRARHTTIADGAPVASSGVAPGTWETVAAPQAMTMVAEFAYRPVGTTLLLVPQAMLMPRVVGPSPKPVKTQLIARDLTYYHADETHRQAFTYPPAVLDAKGGFLPTQQASLVFSVGSCVNCDLTGLDLSGRTMGAIDLSDARIDGATFKGARIASLKLDRARVTGTDFTNAVFTFVSAAGATFAGGAVGTQTTKTVFDGTVLGDRTNFPSQFQGARFTGPDVTLANLDLGNAHWQNVTLSGVVLENVVLDGARMSGATIAHVSTSGGSMVGALFDRATIDTFVVDSARARGVDFSGATLTSLSLVGADLSGARFAGATLTASTFDAAFAVGADFSATTWYGGSFQNVQAYSGGTPQTTTTFAGCTIVSGAFDNALFMESVFDGCRLHGGSFGGSNFVAASLNGVVNVADASGSVLSFAGAALQGAKLGSATLDRVSLLDALISTGTGSTTVTVMTVPSGPSTSGQTAPYVYNYGSTVLPASTTALTICPSGHPGPCTGTAWQARAAPVSTGPQDPNAF